MHVPQQRAHLPVGEQLGQKLARHLTPQARYAAPVGGRGLDAKRAHPTVASFRGRQGMDYILIRPHLRAVRQKLHLSSCSDLRIDPVLRDFTLELADQVAEDDRAVAGCDAFQ